MYMKVPEVFEIFYPADVVLMLLKAMYGAKQAAMHFGKELLNFMKSMYYKRNPADTCMYLTWTTVDLILWLSWIDDCMVWGERKKMMKEKR